MSTETTDGQRIALEGELISTAINNSGHIIYRYLYQNNIYAIACPLQGKPAVIHVACSLPDPKDQQ